MIFKSKENQCLIKVLENPDSYNLLYKKLGFSHSTLQKTLKYLIQNHFIQKTKEGYSILEKGKRLSVLIHSINKMEKH